MNVLYCRVGECEFYRGLKGDAPKGGGSYNETNEGLEKYNFADYDGLYYGYVEGAGGHKTIRVEKILNKNNKTELEFVDDVLVVWVAEGFIVGWYEKATVYSNLKEVPLSVKENRNVNKIEQYNILAKKAVLIPQKERDEKIKRWGESSFGQSNVWYGNYEANRRVKKYIDEYNKEIEQELNEIENGIDENIGRESEVLVKHRLNQSEFRESMLKKYKKCCLCNMPNKELLIASHIKPWSKSNQSEKMDTCNGFLFCPNHDKLFDLGFISFGDDGKVLVSPRLSQDDRTLLNIFDDMEMKLDKGNSYFLKYHRDNIFLKE